LIFTIPTLFLLGYGTAFVLIAMGAVFLCLVFRIFDANSMPVLASLFREVTVRKYKD
jgi:hypothetical protein